MNPFRRLLRYLRKTNNPITRNAKQLSKLAKPIHYLYGKSIQNCNWYLILTGDLQTITTYINDNHLELNDKYLTFIIIDKELD